MLTPSPFRPGSVTLIDKATWAPAREFAVNPPTRAIGSVLPAYLSTTAFQSSAFPFATFGPSGPVVAPAVAAIFPVGASLRLSTLFRRRTINRCRLPARGNFPVDAGLPVDAGRRICPVDRSDHTWRRRAVGFPATFLMAPAVTVALPAMRRPAISGARRFPAPGNPFVPAARPHPVAADPDVTDHRRVALVFDPGRRRRDGDDRIVRRRRDDAGAEQGRHGSGKDEPGFHLRSLRNIYRCSIDVRQLVRLAQVLSLRRDCCQARTTCPEWARMVR